MAHSRFTEILFIPNLLLSAIFKMLKDPVLMTSRRRRFSETFCRQDRGLGSGYALSLSILRAALFTLDFLSIDRAHGASRSARRHSISSRKDDNSSSLYDAMTDQRRIFTSWQPSARRRQSERQREGGRKRERKKENRDRVAHGPAPRLKLAAARVNESTDLLRALLSASLSSFFACQRARRESDTDTEIPSSPLDPLRSYRGPSLVAILFLLLFLLSFQGRIEILLSWSSLVIIGGHEIAL